MPVPGSPGSGTDNVITMTEDPAAAIVTGLVVPATEPPYLHDFPASEEVFGDAVGDVLDGYLSYVHAADGINEAWYGSDADGELAAGGWEPGQGNEHATALAGAGIDFRGTVIFFGQRSADGAVVGDVSTAALGITGTATEPPK